MKTIVSSRWGGIAFLVILASVAQLVSAQSSPVSAESYVQYPSLNPVAAISVNLADIPSGLYDAVTKALTQDPSWNCASPMYYKAAVVDKSMNIIRTLRVAAVRVQGVDPPQDRFVRCDLIHPTDGSGHQLPAKFSGYPGTIDLVLDSAVNSSDPIKIFLYADAEKKTTPLYESDGKLSFSGAQEFTFSVTPQAAPGESLTNGNSRDVGQLALTMSETNIVKKAPFNIYAKSTNLFSTDEKDTKSAFAATFGGQRGILPHWYFPLHLEETIQGNQTATSLSAVTALGVTTLLPWSGTARVANGAAIRVPLPPDLSFAFQYTHRINQLVTAKSPALSDNDISLNPSLTWSTIDFPFTCHLMFWQHAAKEAASPSICLGTELDLGLWYLPLDLNKRNNEMVEGYGDISILVPLANFSFASKALTFVTSGDPAKYRIRIKYSDSVNAANNYARSKQWTYGVELIK